MLALLKEKHKEHLQFLADASIDVVQEFCRISIEFIKNGCNPKVYQSAAQKLEVDAETVQHAVEGLMYLLIETSRLMINEIDFQDSITILGFPDEIVKVLLTMYLENRLMIRNVLSSMSMDLPHYHDMEWRLDVQVASRSLQHQISPNVILKLHLEEDEQKSSHLLQTDPGNLLRLTKELEKALDEMKSTHCHRIMGKVD